MGRIAGQPNKLTTEVKEKLQTVMDDVVSQLDVNSMTIDQKIKMLQLGLSYLLPKLKHTTEEKSAVCGDQPLFIDIITKDEENGGWKSDVRPMPKKGETIQTEDDMPMV